ncbi:unnamed protein product [Triticum turgidum subsp. durum]|uniref:NB-ARC domain-containing protein n=1 Tax=Triticum turgidum subsp. durum TaxID=4567 RepID=A0A9R1RVH4_TRITD|nr:unnamed protein product [Triticum turgidum subsp. durum]
MDGIGGVGKTTLAQHICSHQRVRSHFKKIIWICVSDDFDVKRLTKEVIQSFTGKEATADNLDSLQHALSNHLSNKRLLIVLDDVWDDALKESGQCWKRFCAPFRSVQEGSAMLVTTRCPNVRDGVRTMEPVRLDGLDEDIFWNFFKLCAFGSEESNNDPDLEGIGRSIVPKLKGSPLAAKTLGRMLKAKPEVSHWKSILESKLWRFEQEKTEILPALRLSYLYLPFELKQCFAFCAVYPKDYKFDKEHLAEIWAAEGFVEPQGGVRIQDIGSQYFEDLVARSFFQKVNGGYVIHDLLHDMAQKVSEHDCFILRNKSDFDKVPQSVRHLHVLPSSDFDDSSMLRLCKYTKLRTLICPNYFEKTGIVMGHWCTKLPSIRVISCAFIDELPDSIGNWKHIRYLEISRACTLKRIPSTFCWLYNMQICRSLTSIGGSTNLSLCMGTGSIRAFSSLTIVSISYCDKLSTLDDLLIQEYLPAIEEIYVTDCVTLLSLPGERFGGFPYLKDLRIHNCRSLNWQRRLVLPSSLQKLSLHYCGDMFSSVPSCLTNLTSLVSLTMKGCQGIRCIPGDIWRCNLTSLELLEIRDCPDLVSIGGANAVEKIKSVWICECPNLKGVSGIMRRCSKG